eukprot:CAMPEP_0177287924 /NCGR_PEP_ID=MMETSP0367-20130122/74400_1 /TAXON_ID=447022 ORGANISM="Scrippsiella hangoei-like, Strain SHHI-4" /NCGR_SAMPLE_ID=MMETSP0367 /ASSEMBLY_ACC=CAM_ASM_000362 /LENGTH=140 /DNA_ID=CAMNT_0018745239 /DNA_START=229 /DNA_END=648 /DNA_ORIENTATION=+
MFSSVFGAQPHPPIITSERNGATEKALHLTICTSQPELRALDLRKELVVLGHGAGELRELRGAAHAAEVDVGVVRLALVLEPVVPVVAPAASVLELGRQSVAAAPLGAASVAGVAIEVAGGEALELRRAAVGEGALPGPG